MAPYKCSDGEFGHTSPHLGHTLATLWPHFGHTSATTRPQLGHNSAALRTGEWILPMATFNRRLATGRRRSASALRAASAALFTAAVVNRLLCVPWLCRRRVRLRHRRQRPVRPRLRPVRRPQPRAADRLQLPVILQGRAQKPLLELGCSSAASPLHLVSPPPPPRKVAELFEAKFLQKTAREIAEMRP